MKRETGSTWRPRAGSLVYHRRLTAARIDSRDFIAARPDVPNVPNVPNVCRRPLAQTDLRRRPNVHGRPDLRGRPDVRGRPDGRGRPDLRGRPYVRRLKLLHCRHWAEFDERKQLFPRPRSRPRLRKLFSWV